MPIHWAERAALTKYLERYTLFLVRIKIEPKDPEISLSFMAQFKFMKDFEHVE